MREGPPLGGTRSIGQQPAGVCPALLAEQAVDGVVDAADHVVDGAVDACRSRRRCCRRRCAGRLICGGAGRARSPGLGAAARAATGARWTAAGAGRSRPCPWCRSNRRPPPPTAATPPTGRRAGRAVCLLARATTAWFSLLFGPVWAEAGTALGAAGHRGEPAGHAREARPEADRGGHGYGHGKQCRSGQSTRHDPAAPPRKQSFTHDQFPSRRSVRKDPGTPQKR